MTEDEAKLKWCPMVRYSMTFDDKRNEVAANVWTDGRSKSHCIGSACMMWRTKLIVESGQYAGYDGYCGLAGKP